MGAMVMAMVATDTATAMDTTARGKLRLQLLPNRAMATMVDTEDTDMVTATADMATTVTTARGRLKPLLWLRLSPRLLPSLATDTTVTDMAMVMDMAATVTATATMARGPLRPVLDTTATEDMATDMATEVTGMGMAMDTTARGLLMLDTMAMVATAMAMAMVTDMAMDMDTMDK